MIRSFIMCLTLFMFSSAAKADGMLMIGQGATTCATYNAELQSSPTREMFYLAWAHGYMSAINARNTQTDTSVDLSSQLDTRAQNQFLRGFCMANPDKWFVFGVMELMGILGKT